MSVSLTSYCSHWHHKPKRRQRLHQPRKNLGRSCLAAAAVLEEPGVEALDQKKRSGTEMMSPGRTWVVGPTEVFFVFEPPRCTEMPS